MTEGLLGKRLREYNPANGLEQENILQELIQHFVLASMSRAGFFKVGAFHGGTCLRILHGTSRFSEDLDFLLKEPAPMFSWDAYLRRIAGDALAEGIHFDIDDASAKYSAVKKAVMKTSDFGRGLIRNLPYPRHPAKKIRIKIEVDTNPPEGSRFITQYITFPLTAAIITQDLPSAFGTKSHALLCREYTKGRDWYDFVWFISRRVRPRFDLLGNAVSQRGRWAGMGVEVTADWYLDALASRIESIDWAAVKRDVARFIPDREQESLDHWSAGFFRYQLDRLAGVLGPVS
jgi:hypothetical protein